MSRSLRLAIAQIDPTVGDLAGNAALMKRWLGKAERFEADLVAFPELAITGYPPEDLVFKDHFVDDNLHALGTVASATSTTAAVVGFVDRTAEGIHNAAAVCSAGRVRGIAHKVRLPNYGVFDEMRTFTAGRASTIFVIRGVNVGVVVCEDAWVPDGPVRTLAKLGAEVVVSINASPYHVGKDAERRELCAAHARENRIWFVYAQTIGGQDGLVFDGDSLIFDPRGEVIARGAQFAEDLVFEDIKLRPVAKKIGRAVTIVRISPASSRTPPRPELPRQTRIVLTPAAEVYSALVLGTRDYLKKNGFRSAVIGLSGGIDSALSAVVAADAIGPANVTGVSMPSPFSSQDSFEDAKELATNLGIGFTTIPITKIMGTYEEATHDVFARRERDLTEENIQARIRGNILMALSNKFGHLVLTTGNKSEMATGFTTLYGDLAGGFAVLKDVPKTLVYQLARWRNERGPAVIPHRVLTKPPTAELRHDQRDSDTLPEYHILDPILHAYVEEDRSLEDIVAQGYPAEEVRRILRLVDMSEYKRRQAPPGVKITQRSFGKDRRLPITNHYREGVRNRVAAAHGEPTTPKRATTPKPKRAAKPKPKKVAGGGARAAARAPTTKRTVGTKSSARAKTAPKRSAPKRSANVARKKTVKRPTPAKRVATKKRR